MPKVIHARFSEIILQEISAGNPEENFEEIPAEIRNAMPRRFFEGNR